ncbi:L-lactate MFS transporter [Zavarzinella formosa]|uniref:L-lactate MFS transporter n=1 Tax=Zavarzinella formosa TaxID=360055 RepID=UPI0002F4A8B2|nr:OFA family MFS transporter [Zavarzinella formosa]
MYPSGKPPLRAWVVTLAGTAINLCLGILYAWSVWRAALVQKDHPAGEAMTGLNEGWVYLTNAQATWAYVICGFVFALCMIPGGRIQDKYGPRVGGTLSGLFLAAGCIVAGLTKSYEGLLIGFGLLGGIGMGLGYAAATPAAVKWFGPHQRGLIVGLVVGGFGGAAIYISPLAEHLLKEFGLTGSFIGLGCLFGVVIITAAQFLKVPWVGYIPPAPPATFKPKAMTSANWSASQMLKTIQFYGLVFMFFGAAQSGLLVIGNAKTILNETATVSGSAAFFVTYSWLLSSYGGLVNASGRVGTGLYSDRIGRANAYLINGLVSVVCLALLPMIMESGQVVLLFIVVGVIYWQYGGSLALLPAFTADYFGARNLGTNYGLVFLGWGIGFFMPQVAGYIKDQRGSLELSFYISAGILALAIVISRILKRPLLAGE